MPRNRPGPAPAGDGRIIREIPLIERYSRHNEPEDFRFREFLKFRIKLSADEVDGVVRSTTDEIWSRIDCTTCANCCRTLDVVVDKTDIERLAARVKISPHKFERLYTRRDEFGELCIAAKPCPFLDKANRCSVYEDRPKACRDFPYLHEKHFTSRSMMMIQNNSTCPIVFNVWQALKERLGFRRRNPR